MDTVISDRRSRPVVGAMVDGPGAMAIASLRGPITFTPRAGLAAIQSWLIAYSKALWSVAKMREELVREISAQEYAKTKRMTHEEREAREEKLKLAEMAEAWLSPSHRILPIAKAAMSGTTILLSANSFRYSPT